MEDNRYKSIATKISWTAFEQLKMVADRFNLKIYNLMQFTIDAYLKYFSTDTLITDDTRKVIANFSGLKLAKDGFTMCIPSRKGIKAQRCIMFFEKKGIEQPQALLMKSKPDGEVMVNMNHDTILCSLLNAIAPELIERLDIIRKENNLISLTDGMKWAIKHECNRQYDMTAEIEEMFSDNERSEFGTKPHEGAPYKRRNKRNMEKL